MFRSPSTGSLPHSSATQTRFCTDRIQSVEKHFGEICTALAVYTRKIAGQRDKGDLLAQTLQDYSTAENVNKHCSQGVRDFADSLAFISDYRDLCVHRIEETIIQDVSSYAGICKSALEDVRSCNLAQQKELAQHKHVHKLRQQNPLGRMQISKAESDLQQAATLSVRLGKSMEERVDKLEKKKLEDLIGWLKQLALIEMSFHSSALSILTRTYQQLQSVDLETDLEEFRNTLRLYVPQDEQMSPSRAQSIPSIALPKTPPQATANTNSQSKLKRSKSFSDYRLRAESLDSLKVEEYEELKDVEDSSEDDTEDETEESEEELPARPRLSNIGRRK